jgi:hypothetical protein
VIEKRQQTQAMLPMPRRREDLCRAGFAGLLGVRNKKILTFWRIQGLRLMVKKPTDFRYEKPIFSLASLLDSPYAVESLFVCFFMNMLRIFAAKQTKRPSWRMPKIAQPKSA